MSVLTPCSTIGIRSARRSPEDSTALVHPVGAHRIARTQAKEAILLMDRIFTSNDDL